MSEETIFCGRLLFFTPGKAGEMLNLTEKNRPLSHRERRHFARAAEERREVCRLWLKIARLVRKHTGREVTLPGWVSREVATW